MEQGVIYAIKNLANNKVLIGSTTIFKDLERMFKEAKKTNPSKILSLELQEEWKKCGAENFVLEVLEEFEQEEGQLFEEFEDELLEAEEMWKERFDEKDLY